MSNHANHGPREASMWRWDQGHLPFFQFDALRQIAGFVVAHDFKSATRSGILAATGIDFAAPSSHSPWRNYSRTLKLALLVAESGGVALATPVAAALATSGAVTCDEYLHFIACSFTNPSPALSGYSAKGPFRYPLLFSLKYMLLKAALGSPQTSMEELFGAFSSTTLDGSEDDSKFAPVVGNATKHQAVGKKYASTHEVRQERESLRVIAQLSYLQFDRQTMRVSLAKSDARSLFKSLTPIGAGLRQVDASADDCRA